MKAGPTTASSRAQWRSCREWTVPLALRTARRTGRERLEINGVAHIILRVSRFEDCVAFYNALMPRLGLAAVFRTDEFVYYVGGRTASGSGGRRRN